jgi:hypothetical protein
MVQMTTPYTHHEINFDAALEGYVRGNIDAQALARAVDLVIGSTVPLDADYAMEISELTNSAVKLATYDDAGRAVQRWFAAMDEAGLRY